LIKYASPLATGGPRRSEFRPGRPPLLCRGAVELGDVVPVDEVVDERLEIVRAPVAVVDVVGVLPHVAAEDRAAALHQRVSPVRGFHDGDLAVLDREPAPAGAELGDAGL